MDESLDPQTAAPAVPAVLCAACGYDLRGLPGDSAKCPECGTAIDRASPAPMPWEHRKTIGTRRAYLWTVLLVMFRPGKAAARIAGPVRFEEARRFSRRTALRAWTPIALLLIWTWLATLRFSVVPDPGFGGVSDWRWRGGAYGLRYFTFMQIGEIFRNEPGRVRSLGFALEVLFVVSLLTCSYLAVLGVARAASYFFHPRDLAPVRQNRAVAISYYGAAPLSLLLVLSPLLVFTWWHGVMRDEQLMAVPARTVLIQVGRWIWLLPLGWCWMSNLVLLRRTTGCGNGRAIALAVGLPIMWAVIVAAALSVPAAVLLLSLMLISLR